MGRLLSRSDRKSFPLTGFVLGTLLGLALGARFAWESNPTLGLILGAVVGSTIGSGIHASFIRSQRDPG